MTDSGSEVRTDVEMPHWTVDEMRQLVDSLLAMKSLKDKDHRRAVREVKWDELRIGSHDAEEIKSMCDKMFNHIRRYRTMEEVLIDCANHLDADGFVKILMPKAPLSTFIDYFQRNMDHVREENPGIPMSEAVKLISKNFRSLSEKKKKKYLERYEERKKAYANVVARIRTENPSLRVTKAQAKKLRNPKSLEMKVMKPKTAMKWYIDTQVEGKLKKHPEKSEDDLVKKFKKKWTKLGDEEKEAWVIASVDDRLRYQTELEALRGSEGVTDDVLDSALMKAQLSKSEILLKLSSMGKPKPASTGGYNYYIHTRVGKVDEDGKKLGMSDVAREWKNLSQSKQEKYKAKADKAKKAYESSLAEWKRTVGEDEQHLVDKLESWLKSKPISRFNHRRPSKEKKTVRITGKLKKFRDSDKRQTALDKHLTVNGRKGSPSKQRVEEEEASDEYLSPSAGSDNAESLDDFQTKVAPRAPIASLRSPVKSPVKSQALTPTLLSPMVN